jgi:hypothetical protein
LRIKSLKNRQTNAYKAKLETRFKFAMTRKYVSPYREDDDQEKSKELGVSKKSVVSPSGSAANDALFRCYSVLLVCSIDWACACRGGAQRRHLYQDKHTPNCQMGKITCFFNRFLYYSVKMKTNIP